MNGVLQVEFLDEFRHVVRVRVHLITFPRLAGATMPAAVMRDTAVAAVGKKQHLVFEGVGAQGPSVAKYHRLSFAPIFVINRCAIFPCDCLHGMFSSSPCLPWQS